MACWNGLWTAWVWQYLGTAWSCWDKITLQCHVALRVLVLVRNKRFRHFFLIFTATSLKIFYLSLNLSFDNFMCICKLIHICVMDIDNIHVWSILIKITITYSLLFLMSLLPPSLFLDPHFCFILSFTAFSQRHLCGHRFITRHWSICRHQETRKGLWSWGCLEGLDSRT